MAVRERWQREIQNMLHDARKEELIIVFKSGEVVRSIVHNAYMRFYRIYSDPDLEISEAYGITRKGMFDLIDFPSDPPDPEHIMWLKLRSKTV